MNTAHTPGPWHLSDETERDGLRSRLVHGMPEGMLAIVRVEHQGAYYGDANARLIAAAPDLLACVKDAHAMLRTVEVVDGENGDPWSTALSRMETAIAKATS